MGKISNILRGIPLDIGQKQKVVAHEREFAEMEAQIQALQAGNLKLQAEVNPLHREVERLKREIEQKKPKAHAKLNAVTEVLLKLIANNPLFVVGNLLDRMELPRAELEYHIDLLRDGNFITLVSTGRRGARYNATPAGREYLVRHNLLG